VVDVGRDLLPSPVLWKFGTWTLSAYGASTGCSRIVTARALANPPRAGVVGRLRRWDLPSRRHPSYAASTCCRFGTFTLRVHEYLQASHNRSERELRRIAVGRKGWLFIGSHDHGEAAGHIFSLVASARVHRLNPEGYLRDLFRVLAHWPRDRYLELAPKYWGQTRARLDVAELAAEIGPLTVPPPLPMPSAEQVLPD
jgi:hypothetical protein